MGRTRLRPCWAEDPKEHFCRPSLSPAPQLLPWSLHVWRPFWSSWLQGEAPTGPARAGEHGRDFPWPPLTLTPWRARPPSGHVGCDTLGWGLQPSRRPCPSRHTGRAPLSPGRRPSREGRGPSLVPGGSRSGIRLWAWSPGQPPCPQGLQTGPGPGRGNLAASGRGPGRTWTQSASLPPLRRPRFPFPSFHLITRASEALEERGGRPTPFSPADPGQRLPGDRGGGEPGGKDTAGPVLRR